MRGSHALCCVYRSRSGVRCVSAGSQPDAIVSALDCLVLLHALFTRYRQSGALFVLFTWRRSNDRLHKLTARFIHSTVWRVGASKMKGLLFYP